VIVSTKTETCRGAIDRKRNQAETELFTNFGAGTETETEIKSTSNWNVGRTENNKWCPHWSKVYRLSSCSSLGLS